MQAAPLNCGDNALKFNGDSFGDRFERRISNLRHGYGRVDSGDFNLAASEILHDHIARQHRADLVVGGQRLMRQRRIEADMVQRLRARFALSVPQYAGHNGFIDVLI